MMTEMMMMMMMEWDDFDGDVSSQGGKFNSR